MKSIQKGFTLIELLVVIAIIGLLAGIVLVSLGGARDSARDARIQGAMQQVKSVAELVFNSNSPLGYGGGTQDLCTGTALNSGNTNYGTQLGNLASDIALQGGAAPTCADSTDGYCVQATLATGGTMCVDAEGNQGTSCAGTVCS